MRRLAPPLLALWLGVSAGQAAGQGLCDGPPPAGGFVDRFTTLDPARWQVADWANGGHFLNRWSPARVAAGAEGLRLTLAPDAGGDGLGGGEVRTRRRLGHGLFGARLRASAHPGAITAVFLYTGPAEGTPHHEIDIEIKGDDPTRLHATYWTDGVAVEASVPLPFDASAGFHDYAVRWLPDRIDWLVDGTVVHTAPPGGAVPLPSEPAFLMLNLWGATGAAPWSTDFPPSGRTAAAYACVRVEGWQAEGR
ncbi:family 16 glycosylhydrolase [Caenispirillum bisanense]|uniref:family 16 glycosylhydrolase n=1 Tax=Caenispirillum bisanense TaxID=414052 RepID=UPI0031DAD245